MRKMLVILSVVFSVWVNDASAGFKNGNDLHRLCQTQLGSLNSVDCLAYIQGVYDVLISGYVHARYAVSCAPDKVSGRQVYDIVKIYLERHPNRRHFPAWSIISDAMRQAFPCN
jgi:hypothetical protein